MVAIPAIIVGPLVLLKSRKKVNLIWAAFLTSVVWWGLGIYKFSTAGTYENTLFWLKITEVGVILIPVFLVHFVVSFLNLNRRFLIGISYFIGILFIYVNLFTDLFINKLYFVFDQFYYPIATPFYAAFIVFFISSVVYSIYELNRVYEKSIGIKRAQIKYLILSFFVGFSGGLSSFPLIYKINIYPAWNGTIFVAVLMVSYAMLRYRLMDIRIAIRKAIFYLLMAGFAYGFFYLLVWFYPRFLGGFYTSKTYVSGVIVALLFVGVSTLFSKWAKNITNKYLFSSLYSYQETIAKLAEELNDSIDLDKIVNSIVDTIKETMQLDRAGVLLISEEQGNIRYKIAKVIGFDETNGISLVQDSFLTRHLQKRRKALIREELSILAKETGKITEKESFQKLEKNMEKIEASLCLPLISGAKLIGIIVLGSKLSGDAYSKEDLQLLEMLSSQAATAIENANLYKRVQEFSKTLEQKVGEQTKELREQKEEVEKAYQVEKQAHEDLLKLDEAKTNFMLVTQHHLRTPLSITMGFLDLLLSGHFGKMPKKVLETIQKTEESIKKEIEVVDDLLNVSAFQLGHGYVQLQPCVPIKSMLEEIVTDLVPVAEKKNIYLKFESKKDIPEITVDQKQIKMALQNIVDNAIKYTKKGGVAVKINSENDTIKIEVKDTGIGMDDNDKKYLFEKPFQRSEEAWSANATGKGIGVYLSAQIIKAHGGDIKADSAGRGKGSVFNIELPVDATPFANKKPVSLANGNLISKV